MAEGLLKRYLKEKGRDDINVISAGTGALSGYSPTANTIEVMKKEGVDVSGHKTALVTEKMIRQADLILVMEKAHKEEIIDRVPDAVGKTFLLTEFKKDPGDRPRLGEDVLDPMGRPLKDYAYTLMTIKKEIERITPHLLKS